MNFRQLQYAVILSKFLNISQAAEQLGITQPALSKQILTLEKELGIQLFDRNTVPLTITPAGESFIRETKEILLKEDRLKRSMEQFRTGERGRLVIGISPFRATYFLSEVIKKLNEQFPFLQVVLSEKNSTQLQKDTIDGLVDFSVLNLPVDENLLDVIELEGESVVLAVPEKYAKKLIVVHNKLGKYPIISLSECKEIPFIALGPGQELRNLFDKMCEAEAFTPNITTQVVGVSTALSLVKAGIGASILPSRFVSENAYDCHLAIFTVKNSPSSRQPAIVMKKGRYMSSYAEQAIKIIKDWQ